MGTALSRRRAAILAAAVVTAGTARAAEETRTVLITGANRGLGLEFARQYAAKGWKVIATSRRPEEAAELQAIAKANPKVSLERLDVMDDAAIDALAAKLKGQPIDVLLNNAGISGGNDTQQFGKIDYASFEDVMRTNVKGPLKISEAFTEHVAASTDKKMVVVSSSEGSLAGVTAPRNFFYRPSKAAVNMAMRNVALAVKPRGISVGMVNPGPTATDFMKNVRMPLRAPDLAVREMIAVIDKLSLETSGLSINYDGKPVPW